MSPPKGAPLRLIGGHDDLLQALFNRASIGITVMDLSGQFVQANPAFLHLLQYSIHELQGLDVQKITHPDDWPACVNQLGDLIAGNHESFQLEKRIRRKDQEYITVRVTVSLTSSDPAELRFLIAVAEDVTERAAAEARMEHLLSLLTATLESSADGVLVLDQELLTAIRAECRGRVFVDASLPARSLEARRLPATPPRLSARELEVLSVLAAGYSYEEASKRLSITPKTVETYRTRLGKKLGIQSRAALVAYALKTGLLTHPLDEPLTE